MARKQHRSWKHRDINRVHVKRTDWAFYRLAGLLAAALFVVIVFWPSANKAVAVKTDTASSDFQCRVASVTDGDTLRCNDGTRVRLHAVAARESDETCSPGHPCPAASAVSATAKLTELAGGQTLQCEATGTSYQRITAICRNQQNVEINCAMIRSGTAVIWPRYNVERRLCEGR